MTDETLDRLMPKAWLRCAAISTFLLRGDPGEHIRKRTRQLVEMSRYARAGSPGELLGWDDVEVVRFNELMAALGDLAAEEGPFKALAEMG